MKNNPPNRTLALTLVLSLSALAGAQSITSFSPMSGPTGTVVDIQGSGFTNATQFCFFKEKPSSFVVKNDHWIQATVPAPATTGILRVTVNGVKAFSAASFTVTNPPNIASFSASPATVVAGKPIALTWNVSGATSLSISGVGNVSGTSTTVIPNANSTYTLTATNVYGTATASASVVVTPAPAVELMPTGAVLPSSGGVRKARVKVNNGRIVPFPICSVPWLGATVSGGWMTITAQANPDASPRTGSVTYGGATFTINQDGYANLVHPRLWFGPADVQRYRSWANPTNVAYKNLVDAENQAAADCDARFGTPQWQDAGISTFNADTTEDIAAFFAFKSLIEPDAAKAQAERTRAKTMLMWVINQAALGYAAGVPFRDPRFATVDRGRLEGWAFPLTVDMLYDSFTPAEKAKIRDVFLRWAEENRQWYNASTSSKALRRLAGNNYQIARARQITMFASVMDPADDPTVDQSKNPLLLGNSLRSYLGDTMGRTLPTASSLFEGDASGGFPIEGPAYGGCNAFLLEDLLTLHNTGVDQPNANAALSLIDSPYWDDFTVAWYHQLAPALMQIPGMAYVGSIFEQFGYGDMLRAWAIPQNVWMLGARGMLDYSLGNPSRYNAMRYAAVNTLEASADWQTYNPGRQWWSNSNAADKIFLFALSDPDAGVPVDPRPSLPLTTTPKGYARMLSRTDWAPSATVFGVQAGWNQQDHQNGDAGSIDLYRNGEMLSHEVSGYTGQHLIDGSGYANTLAIENDMPTDLSWFEANIYARGSQWICGMAAGDPVSHMSSGAGYVYADVDMTQTYNRVTYNSKVTDVKQATRSALWIQPDVVILYDRATTGKSGRFKRFNLQFPTLPSINGSVATMTTAKGQKVFVQSLLPLNATMSASAAEADGQALGETMNSRLVVEDPSKPANVRFLHVIRMTDGQSVPNATPLVSTVGTSFEGAIVGGCAALFPHDTNGFSGTTYLVPSAVTTHYVGGLTPYGTYDVSIVAVPGGYQITVNPGNQFVADKAGLLTFATSQLQP